MISQTFIKQARVAARLDCATICTMNQLKLGESQPLSPKYLELPTELHDFIQLADAIYEDGADFIDDMDASAARVKRPAKYKQLMQKCVHCGDPYCGNAEMFAVVPNTHIEVTLELGPAPPVETDEELDD